MNAIPPTPAARPDRAIEELIAPHRGQPGALLPLLHDVQDTLGHIPAEAVPLIAQALNLSRAEVHGVITYYHHLRRAPAGRTVVQVCRAEACQACGGEALFTHAQALLGCGPGQTRTDGAYTLEPVYCLGLCASSPAVAVNETPHARMTPEKLDRVIAACAGKHLGEHLGKPEGEQESERGAQR